MYCFINFYVESVVNKLKKETKYKHEYNILHMIS